MNNNNEIEKFFNENKNSKCFFPVATWDLLKDLDSMYEIVPMTLKVSPDDFIQVPGGSLILKPKICNEILNFFTVQDGKSIITYITEEIDWNFGLSFNKPGGKPISEKIVKKKVGCLIEKTLFKLNERGALVEIPRVSKIFNACDRVYKLFNDEEAKTEDYDLLDERGGYKYSFYDKSERRSKEGYAYSKYSTIWSRRAAFQEMLKFCTEKAETTCKNRLVRAMVGIQSSFSPDDIRAEGCLKFVKVGYSANALNAMTLARIDNIKIGATNNIMFGDSSFASKECLDITLKKTEVPVIGNKTSDADKKSSSVLTDEEKVEYTKKIIGQYKDNKTLMEKIYSKVPDKNKFDSYLSNLLAGEYDYPPVNWKKHHSYVINFFEDNSDLQEIIDFKKEVFE